MASPEIEEFAKLLVEKVRDSAIRECDGNLHPHAKHVIAQRWKKLDLHAGLESVAHTLIPDVVDDTVFQLLQAIDGRQLKLSFTASNGKTLYLPEDGLWELAGDYASIPGWRSMFSRERYIDDFAHLPDPGEDEMSNRELEEFAKLLVREVRDAAIRSCDRRLRPDAGSVIAQRWKKLDLKNGLEAVARTLIQDVVDDTVFQLLRAIDGGELQLSFTASNGKKVDLSEDGLGELAGWYMGIPGWRSAFSKERYFDDFSDCG